MVCDRPFKYIIKEETADSDLIYLTSKYNLTLPDSFYEEMKGKSASSNSKRAYTNWQGNLTSYRLLHEKDWPTVLDHPNYRRV